MEHTYQMMPRACTMLESLSRPQKMNCTKPYLSKQFTKADPVNYSMKMHYQKRTSQSLQHSHAYALLTQLTVLLALLLCPGHCPGP